MGLLLALAMTVQAEPSPRAVDTAFQRGLRTLRTDASASGDLVLWTLASADVPAQDSTLQRQIQRALETLPTTTAAAAMQAMAFDRIDRRKYLDRIAYAVQFIVDHQAADGLWPAAGEAVEPPRLDAPPRRPADPPLGPVFRVHVELRQRRDPPASGDSVQACWAALGLQAGYQIGLIARPAALEKAEAAWRSVVRNADPTDVISGLSIALFQQKRDWKKDPDVLRAVDRLILEDRPAAPKALYGLRRSMLHLDREKLADKEWYPELSRTLIAAQREDGRWGGIEETCYALLALHVTRPRSYLPEPARRK